MARFIKISKAETFEKIEELKAHHKIFQTTKLLEFLIDQELENLKEWNESENDRRWTSDRREWTAEWFA